jgi:hypothetical protein
MTELLDAWHPRYGEAIAAFREVYGMDVRNTLLPDQWAVAMIDGKPEVIVYREGMRALALLSHDPTAAERVGDYLAQLDRRNGE